jgi:hypothetical protein
MRRVLFTGATPPSITPVETYYRYVVVHIGAADGKTTRFERGPGYHLVLDLDATEAEKLFPEVPDGL